jgi:hypothetical protein
VLPVLLALTLLQVPCGGAAAALADQAAAAAEAFETTRATALLRRAAAGGCAEADIAAWYLTGLDAAREAYAAGGDERSLAPVRAAEEALARHERQGSVRAGIARVALMAAAAAAQSERDDVKVFLQHATQLETAALAAGGAGAPLATAHEVAGDLWLRVHRFDAARAAYLDAAAVAGRTPRILIGLARTADRLKDPAAACDAYAGLTTWWGTRRETPREIVEARAYLSSTACAARGAAGGR